MNENDLKQLELTINAGYKNINNPLWVKAFEYYNNNHPNQKPLGMACRPCYMKVFNFIKGLVKTNPNQ